MSWQAVKEVLAFGTPQGPLAFENVFKSTGKKGARGLGYGPKKAVLMVLAERHRWPKCPKSAEVRVTYAALAEAAACSIDTVKRACDWLDKTGLAVHEFAHDERGRRASNRFFINFDGLEREEFSVQVLGKIVPKRRKPPKGQIAFKAQDRLKGNLLRPKGQNAGDQSLKPISADERETEALSLREPERAQQPSNQRRQPDQHPLKTRLDDGWVPNEQEVAWVHMHYRPAKEGASLDDVIKRSSKRFLQFKGETARTPEGWQSEWEHWWEEERLTCRRTQVAPAPRGIRREILMRALTMYLRGIPFDQNLCHPPANPAEATAWLADLERSEEEFVTEFRSSSPPPSPPASTTEPRVATPCA